MTNPFKSTTAPWDCRDRGHIWTNTTGELTPLRCIYCPARALQCPECKGFGGARGRQPPSCTRCRGTGSVEVCEVGRADLAYLVLTARRFKFLLNTFASMRGGDPAAVVCELDTMMAAVGLEEPA